MARYAETENRSSNELELIRNLSAFLLVGLMGSLLYSIPATAGILFTDGTFNLNNYTITTYNNLPPPNTVSLLQNTSGGNPGAWLAEVFSVPGVQANTEVISAVVNNGWTYSPSTQGAISSIDFSLDKFSSTTFSSEAATLLLLQDGIYYINSVAGPNVIGWETFTNQGITSTAGWSAINLASGVISGGAHPNFAAAGDPISIGLVIGLTGSIGGGSFTIGADNLRVDINPNAVPEPGTIACLTVGLGLLFIVQRRARRKTCALNLSAFARA